MNYKVIEEEDHKKVVENIFPVGFHPIKYKEEYEGCLFVYDEEFILKFEDLMDEKIGYSSGLTLEYFLREWNRVNLQGRTPRLLSTTSQNGMSKRL
jgi:hypothetical protein